MSQLGIGYPEKLEKNRDEDPTIEAQGMQNSLGENSAHLIDQNANTIENMLREPAGVYFSTEELNKKFSEILGCSLPQHEIERLRGLLPSEITPEKREQLIRLKKATEGKNPPFLFQIPQVFVVNGEEIPFTLANLMSVWNNSDRRNEKKWWKKMYISPNVGEHIKNHVWTDGHLYACSSQILKGSREKSYNEQLGLQKNLVGEKSEIGVEAYMALLFHYLIFDTPSKDYLGYDFMRLNILDKKPEDVKNESIYTLCVASDHDGLYLGSWHERTHVDGGIGAAIILS